MANEPFTFSADMRDRIEDVKERIIRGEGRQDGHEKICADRYAQIVKDIAELKILITFVAKTGLIICGLLFMLELGKATFPVISEVLKTVIR